MYRTLNKSIREGAYSILLIAPESSLFVLNHDDRHSRFRPIIPFGNPSQTGRIVSFELDAEKFLVQTWKSVRLVAIQCNIMMETSWVRE